MTIGSSRRVPEGVPLFPIDQLGCESDFELTKRLHLLFRQTAHAAGHLELGRKIVAEHSPTGALMRRELLYHRLRVADRKAGAKLLPALTLPGGGPATL